MTLWRAAFGAALLAVAAGAEMVPVSVQVDDAIVIENGQVRLVLDADGILVEIRMTPKNANCA